MLKGLIIRLVYLKNSIVRITKNNKSLLLFLILFALCGLIFGSILYSPKDLTSDILIGSLINDTYPYFNCFLKYFLFTLESIIIVLLTARFKNTAFFPYLNNFLLGIIFGKDIISSLHSNIFQAVITIIIYYIPIFLTIIYFTFIFKAKCCEYKNISKNPFCKSISKKLALYAGLCLISATMCLLIFVTIIPSIINIVL